MQWDVLKLLAILYSSDTQYSFPYFTAKTKAKRIVQLWLLFKSVISFCLNSIVEQYNIAKFGTFFLWATRYRTTHLSDPLGWWIIGVAWETTRVVRLPSTMLLFSACNIVVVVVAVAGIMAEVYGSRNISYRCYYWHCIDWCQCFVLKDQKEPSGWSGTPW